MRAALAALVLGVALPARAADAPAPYSIAVINNMTGANAYAGQTETAALRVFEKYINARGGIHGRPVRFAFYDDQTNPKTAVQLLDDEIAKNPVVILGSGQVQTCAAMAPLVENGPVVYCFTPGFSPKKGGYMFSASAALNLILPADLRFIRERGWKRFTYISVASASGQAADIALKAALAKPENRDLTLTDLDSFNPADISATALVARVKATNPQVVLTAATGAAFGTLLRSMNDAGLHVPVLTSAGNEQPEQLKAYNDFLPPAIFFNGMLYYARSTIRPGPIKDAIDRFYAAFKAAGVAPTPDSGQAWDPALIVCTALNALPADATATQLRDYIASMHGFAGSDGFYDFRRGDGHGLDQSSIIFVRWDSRHEDFALASRRGGAKL